MILAITQEVLEKFMRYFSFPGALCEGYRDIT